MVNGGRSNFGCKLGVAPSGRCIFSLFFGDLALDFRKLKVYCNVFFAFLLLLVFFCDRG